MSNSSGSNIIFSKGEILNVVLCRNAGERGEFLRYCEGLAPVVLKMLNENDEPDGRIKCFAPECVERDEDLPQVAHEKDPGLEHFAAYLRVYLKTISLKGVTTLKKIMNDECTERLEEYTDCL